MQFLRKIEKIYLINLGLVLGIIISYYFQLNTYFIIGLLIIGLILFYLSNENYKDYILFVLILLFGVLEFSLFSIKTDLKSDKIYTMSINVEKDKIKVLKIDGKYPLKNYIVNSKNKNYENGNYKIDFGLEYKKDYSYYNILYGDIISIESNFFNKIRNLVNDKLEKLSQSNGMEFYGFAKAVVLGEKDFITDEINNSFRNTGTSHLLVISGLHIGIVIIFTLKILELIGIGFKKRYIFAAIFLTIFVFTAGFSPSVLRAYIMGISMILAKILGEKYSIKKAVSLSMIVSLIINPTTLFSVSFQLSYMALFGIIYIYKFFDTKVKDRFFKPILFSLSIQIALTPLFLYYFHEIPILSFIPNIIAVPFGSIVVQLIFMGLLISYIINPIGELIFYIASMLFKILIIGINFLENMPFLKLELTQYISLEIIFSLYIIIIIIFVSNFSRDKKLYLIVAMFLLIINFDIREQVESYNFGRNRFISNKRLSFIIKNSKFSKYDIINLDKNGINRVGYIFDKTGDKAFNEKLKPKEVIRLNKGEKAIIDNIELQLLEDDIKVVN